MKLIYLIATSFILSVSIHAHAKTVCSDAKQNIRLESADNVDLPTSGTLPMTVTFIENGSVILHLNGLLNLTSKSLNEVKTMRTKIATYRIEFFFSDVHVDDFFLCESRI